jgi:hypothetical protein
MALTILKDQLLELLDQEPERRADGTRMIVRSFQLLCEFAADLSGQDKADLWGSLAQRIHFHIPGWNAAGPSVLGDGAIAYWGGIPKGYVVIFRPNGDVFFTRYAARPGPAWIPDYVSLQSIAEDISTERR